MCLHLPEWLGCRTSVAGMFRMDAFSAIKRAKRLTPCTCTRAIRCQSDVLLVNCVYKNWTSCDSGSIVASLQYSTILGTCTTTCTTVQNVHVYVQYYIQITNYRIEGAALIASPPAQAYVLDYNIYLYDLSSDNVTMVTVGGSVNKVIYGVPDWVYEGMDCACTKYLYCAVYPQVQNHQSIPIMESLKTEKLRGMDIQYNMLCNTMYNESSLHQKSAQKSNVGVGIYVQVGGWGCT